MELEIGRTGRAEAEVTPPLTAQALGSGSLPVYGTPMLVALMETAAVNALEGCLKPGVTSVGTRLDISHDAATPVGMKVWAEAEVTAIHGREVVFSVSAFDGRGPIGKGVHHRFLVTSERFLAKAQAKLG